MVFLPCGDKTQSNKTLDFRSYSLLAEEYGPSFYVLDASKLNTNIRSLYNSFLSEYKKVEIGYSYKTNYTPHICRILHDAGAWAEIVSDMEYEAAKRLGVPISKMIFNGPYKLTWAFREAALGGALISLDSQRDLNLLKEIASLRLDNKIIRVLLRTNFPIDEKTSRFGFDASGNDISHALETISSFDNVTLAGLHCHFPNRDLESFRRRAEVLVELCKKIFPDKPPEILDIGGGFFSSLPDSLQRNMTQPPPTFSEYASVIGRILSSAFPDPNTSPTLFLEPGTALVADVLTFYTQIVSIKTIRDHNFAAVAGSIFDISPNAKTRYLPVTPILNPHASRGKPSEYCIVGFTCIEDDILTETLKAALTVGDVLAYGNVGSYSVVMRPPFILPSSPILMMRPDSSDIELIKEKQSNYSVFELFAET